MWRTRLDCTRVRRSDYSSKAGVYKRFRTESWQVPPAERHFAACRNQRTMQPARDRRDSAVAGGRVRRRQKSFPAVRACMTCPFRQQGLAWSQAEFEVSGRQRERELRNGNWTWMASTIRLAARGIVNQYSLEVHLFLCAGGRARHPSAGWIPCRAVCR